MNTQVGFTPPITRALPNGSGAAAVLSAAAGCFTLSVLSILGDKSEAISKTLILYKPTGPLSGVTTGAILVWFFIWAILGWRWRKKIISVRHINTVAIVLVALSLLLTFPPIGDMF